jgi:adenine-specific DNA-methyltransferase
MPDQKPKEAAIVSPDVCLELREKIRQIYPPLFSDEGHLNEKELKVLDRDCDLTDANKFEFRWAGKLNSKRHAFSPSRARLKPDLERSVDFEHTQNIIIEGENLETLKLLLKAYYNKVKCIYIDPPYNTGHDFVYSDDYSEGKKAYWEQNGTTEKGVKIDTNPETAGRYHSNWLNMMQGRLLLAQQLLRDDGVIFVSIDNNEIHNLRKLMDEVFGEENFVECLVWNKRIPKNDEGIGSIHEYVLIYVKNFVIKHEFRMQKEGLEDIGSLLVSLKKKKVPIPEAETEIAKLYKKKGYDRGITLYNSLNSEYRLWGKINMSWPNADTFGPRYNVFHPITGKPVKVPDRGWRWKEETFIKEAGYQNGKYTSIVKLHDGTFLCGRIWFGSDEKMQPSSVNFLDEVNYLLLRSVVSLKSDGGIELEKLFEGKSYFSYPKPTSLLRTLIGSIQMNRDDLVLDFFAGSGTTAQAIMELNREDGGVRRSISVQIPEATEEGSEAFKAGYKKISDITIERVRRAGGLIKKEKPEVDTGFKIFTLEKSLFPANNFTKDPAKSEAENEAAFKEYLERAKQTLLLRPDGEESELLFELMLKDGFGLNFKDERLPKFRKNHIRRVSDGVKEVLVCLDDNLDGETVEALGKHKDQRLMLLRQAVDTNKKWNLSRVFGDNLAVI